jgi:protein SCO1/2
VASCGSQKPAFQNIDITGANFGRDFSLTDQNGVPRKLADFRGKAVVIFFGYTQCPDVCPTTLADLASAMQALGAESDRVQVLFVTIDPERDTPQVLASYVPNFDKRFLGLYGDAAATANTAREFKVFYQKVDGPTPTSYTMDHSAGSYVFDPEGHLRVFLRNEATAQSIAHDLKILLS